jgi:hypothetical protein
MNKLSPLVDHIVDVATPKCDRDKAQNRCNEPEAVDYGKLATNTTATMVI